MPEMPRICVAASLAHEQPLAALSLGMPTGHRRERIGVENHEWLRLLLLLVAAAAGGHDDRIGPRPSCAGYFGFRV